MTGIQKEEEDSSSVHPPHPPQQDIGISASSEEEEEEEEESFSSSSSHDHPPPGKETAKVGSSRMDSSNTTTSTTTSTLKHQKQQTIISSWTVPVQWTGMIVLDVVLFLVVVIWATTVLLQKIYQGPIRQELVKQFRRLGTSNELGYFPDFHNDVTYYGRQCSRQDITTTNSNDLLLHPKITTSQDAAHTMMTHGAVLIPQLLLPSTASQLREYLETRHAIQDQLPWHEKFWAEIGRLSLGLGAMDHPIIAQALQEVGSNELLQTTLQGIVGDDPAIVEISTLTTMHGAEEQGIHTDSDYFGSSLLYSRNFLHSYTLFMALQNTTSRMGATTVCPGTQWCANEDMTDICTGPNDNLAFEVSSNGQTGKNVGVLYQGDGMMFNQNVWHRGPQNYDVNFPMNRVMFILTFVSRQEWQTKGDVRQQGLGTYYYQRWNMWGHSFQDLKHSWTRMKQPWAALKALGLFKWPNTSNYGIPWLEHFARQLANEEDFFTTDELYDFVEFLNKSLKLPTWLQGDPEEERWEWYLEQMLNNIVTFVNRIHWIMVGSYLGIYMISKLIFVQWFGNKESHDDNVDNKNQQKKKPWTLLLPSFVMKVIVIHGMVTLVAMAIWYHVRYTSYMAKRIQFRNEWNQPFATPSSMNHLTSTTFPERMDILIGTRFDTPYLASFDKVLDYHPGNVRYLQVLENWSKPYPNHSEDQAQLVLDYLQQPIQGVTPRFLLQDWSTGYWQIMKPKDSMEVIRRALVDKNNTIKQQLGTYLKQVLANARFGLQRNQIMTRVFTPKFVSYWEQVLYNTKSHETREGGSLLVAVPKDTATTTTKTTESKRSSSWMKPLPYSWRNGNKKPSTYTKSIKSNWIVNPFCYKLQQQQQERLKDTYTMDNDDDVVVMVRPGDRVLCNYFGSGNYQDAIVLFAYNENWVHVEYVLDGLFQTVSINALQPYRSIVQGDMVQVYSDYEEDYVNVLVTRVHPLQMGLVQYAVANDEDDDEEEEEEEVVEEEIPLNLLRFDPSKQPKVKIVQSKPLVLTRGQHVLVNYQGRGEWFHATIQQVYDNDEDEDEEDTTRFRVRYVDGDYEDHVPIQHIRPMSLSKTN